MNPTDLETWRRLRRLSLHLRDGPRAGTTLQLLALSRFLSMRGHQAGQRAEGRLRDYMFVLSALKDRTIFRRREIAPLRRMHLVVDVRDFGTEADERLLRATELIGGLMLAMPGSRVSFTVWGAANFFSPQTLAGPNQWPWFCAAVRGLKHFRVNKHASHGALRHAASTDESAFLVLATSWVEPNLLQGLPVPFGGVVFVVDPARQPKMLERFGMVSKVLSLFNPEPVGVNEPVLSALPAEFAEGRDEDRFAQLGEACARARLDLVHIQSSGDLLDRLETLVSQ